MGGVGALPASRLHKITFIAVHQEEGREHLSYHFKTYHSNLLPKLRPWTCQPGPGMDVPDKTLVQNQHHQGPCRIPSRRPFQLELTLKFSLRPQEV